MVTLDHTLRFVQHNFLISQYLIILYHVLQVWIWVVAGDVG